MNSNNWFVSRILAFVLAWSFSLLGVVIREIPQKFTYQLMNSACAMWISTKQLLSISRLFNYINTAVLVAIAFSTSFTLTMALCYLYPDSKRLPKMFSYGIICILLFKLAVYLNFILQMAICRK